MDITSLDSLAQEVGGKIPPIRGIGDIMVDPEGFIMMNVKIPCVNLLSNGGNQGKQNLRVGHTMGLLESLLVDARHTGPNEPVEC